MTDDSSSFSATTQADLIYLFEYALFIIIMILFSFLFFLLVFVAIGVFSVFYHKKTSHDYLLAGSNVKPWLAALSAVATNNSGYMFVGQIGFTYLYGLHSIWLMIGWIFGDFLASTFVHARLRHQTEKRDALSFAGIMSNWHGQHHNKVRILGGVITLAFLATYAGAQLNAGSKALHVLFGWDYSIGAIIGAVMVLAYCFAGGIRASIWTDAAQSFVMILAMGLMLFLGLQELGGISSTAQALQNVSENYMNLFPQDRPGGVYFGPLLFILGWMFAGMGVIGQPHIMVRFMAMNDAKNMGRARLYYYSWYSLFFAATIIVALMARLLIPDVSDFDPELALPSLAKTLLPDILVGLVLAGLFAATMSTADSQILSCTATITSDLSPKKFSGYKANKIATFCITAFALAIALSGYESVFALVVFAWSGLACSFGPLLIAYALGYRTTETWAIATMLGGLGTMLTWHFAGLGNIIYEVAPGMLGGLIVFICGKTLSKKDKITRTNQKQA